MAVLESLRISGPLACFTRPELKAERMSYQTITPSAARGILDAILWKPAMRWRIERIKVLSPIQFTSFRRNEVGVVARTPGRTLIKSGGEYSPLIIEDRRQQRNTVALRDVDYIVEARIELTDRAQNDDTLVKFTEMFRRRLAKGQHFHQPYLGCREFIAEIEPVNGQVASPIAKTCDLGLMLWDIEFSTNAHGKPENRPIFFVAKMERGVVEVPPTAEAAEATLQTARSSDGTDGAS